MAFTKHFKFSSALLLGTLTAGTLMSEAAYGADAAKRILDAQHAQRMAAAGGAHATQTANITKLKDAMAHPDLALDPATAGSVGDALTAAAGDNTCAVGGAGGGGGAMPIGTEEEQIAAIRALELAAHPGDADHRQAIRTALGLDPANLPGTQAELNHFLTAAEERLVHLPQQQRLRGIFDTYVSHLNRAQAELATGAHMANVVATLVGPGGVNAAPIAAPMPHGTPAERVLVLRAVERAPAGGANDAGKRLIRQAIGLPGGPTSNPTYVRLYIKVARP